MQPQPPTDFDRSRAPTLEPGLCVGLFPGRGRGVVALRGFSRGELVERAPVIVLAPADRERIQGTLLARYYFEWGDDEASAAIALGYGSLYNHSYDPNLRYEFFEQHLAIDFVALRDIAAGEELGDVSTLRDPEVVESLQKQLAG